MNLPCEALAAKFCRLQEDKSLGLIKECEEHLNNLNFSVNRHSSKWFWKKEVKKYIIRLNRECLLEDMKKYKKLDYNTCVNETFERKSYFFDLNLEQVHDNFRIWSHMVETVRRNFPSKYKNKSLDCQSCKNVVYDVNISKRDSQTHLLEVCPVFSDLRGKCDLQSDRGIVDFFKAVISHRIENGEV